MAAEQLWQSNRNEKINAINQKFKEVLDFYNDSKSSTPINAEGSLINRNLDMIVTDLKRTRMDVNTKIELAGSIFIISSFSKAMYYESQKTDDKSLKKILIDGMIQCIKRHIQNFLGMLECLRNRGAILNENYLDFDIP